MVYYWYTESQFETRILFQFLVIYYFLFFPHLTLFYLFSFLSYVEHYLLPRCWCCEQEQALFQK